VPPVTGLWQHAAGRAAPKTIAAVCVPLYETLSAHRMSGPVNPTARIVGLLAWAVAGVPATCAAFVASSYRFALERGQLPFASSKTWVWLAAYCLSVGSGLLAVALLPLSRHWLRALIGITYLGSMGVLLLGVSLGLSCHYGDCL
jgi:hypothetical protein